jgi:hypothetical protein
MDWGHRLKIHGLDLRHSECGDFLQFIEQKIQAIGYLINNGPNRETSCRILHPFNGKRRAFHCFFATTGTGYYWIIQLSG